MMSLLSFPREIGLRRNICANRHSFDSYVDKLNGKASCYTSLYSFERRHPLRSWKMDPDSVIMDRAWWDFDVGEGTTIDDVKSDVHTLVGRLEGDIRLVATGRGFHVHQLFESPVKGPRIAPHIDRYQREKGTGLKTLDGVGHPQKLTRVPDTFNPTRERWAVNIDLTAFMLNPQSYQIPILPDPTLTIHDPFRGRVSRGSFNIVNWIHTHPITPITLKPFTGTIGTVEQIPLPPCLERAVRVSNPKHHIRVALGQYLAEDLRWFADPDSLDSEKLATMENQILSFIQTLGWRDYNESISRGHIRSILKYRQSPSRQWFISRGICDGDCWLHGK